MINNRLWDWFSLSYSSWLTMPRVMMHEMPDEWQEKMAALLEEWDEHWDFKDIDFETCVQLRENGKFLAVPNWLSNYRYPSKKDLNKLKRKQND